MVTDAAIRISEEDDDDNSKDSKDDSTKTDTKDTKLEKEENTLPLGIYFYIYNLA